MIPLSGAIGFPCRSSETGCRLRVVPAGQEPSDLQEADELRARHEKRRHRYVHGATTATTAQVRVRKIRPRDLLPARVKCANPDCTLDFPRGGKGAYCPNCQALFRTSPERRPQGRFRCNSCGQVFTVPKRNTPGRYSTTCSTCRDRVAGVGA